VPRAMQIIFFLGLFVVAGIAVIFIAFWGGPSSAREAYLTRGGRWFVGGIVLLYVVLGLVVPAVVINSREEAVGATGSLRTENVSGKLEDGKSLFIENCKSCHTLAAVQAHGVTGPNLDDLGPDKQRVLNAIKNGGTGQGRMPKGLLEGEDAQNVATFVSSVAGQ
jgi:cytochrome c553